VVGGRKGEREREIISKHIQMTITSQAKTNKPQNLLLISPD